MSSDGQEGRREDTARPSASRPNSLVLNKSATQKSFASLATPGADNLTALSFEECRIITFLTYRHHLIPPMIFLTFVIMMVICFFHAPGQYREFKVFQVSNLGNWGNGISFFSSAMVIIAALILRLTSEIITQRILRLYRKKILTSYGPVVYKIGSVILFCGLIVTGCFQQSHNRPMHNIGVLAMAVGFGLILYYDMMSIYYSTDQTTPHKVSAILQIILAIVIVVSGVAFVVLLALAKLEWSRGRADALAKLNLTECPRWDVDAALSGGVYPYYYPCKSTTLWLPEDPGWDEFKFSSLMEMIMFLCIAVYPLTYLLQLKKVKTLPGWLVPVLKIYVPLRGSKYWSDLPVSGTGNC